MNRKLTIMPCLDMINGRVVKGVNFVNIKDAGDPVECCKAYCAAGADELAMLDITATVEGRKTMLEVVRKVADAVTVPFTMGGGISSVAAAEEVLKAGANKVSTSSAVFRRPEMIGEMVKELGADKVTVAIDVAQNAAMPSGYEVFIDGGRTATGKDAIEWAKQVNDYGVACILPTSKSTDGVRTGSDPRSSGRSARSQTPPLSRQAARARWSTSPRRPRLVPMSFSRRRCFTST